MATKTISHFAISLQPHHLPSTVSHAAARSLYNYIGCAIGGSSHPTVLKAHRALEPFFGKPTSTVLGHRRKLKSDAQHAALLNGIASHVHDYDDTHLETIIHPAGTVASALLAAVQMSEMQAVSGEMLLTALTAGIEISCKLGLAVWPSHYDTGWHITSTCGAIGAAVAVGKILKLTESQMNHAIGVAATQVVGLREMFGSDTKSFHVGRAAQAGLMAAVLAREDWTSSETAIEAKRGWAACVSEEEQLEEVVVKGLGKMAFVIGDSQATYNAGMDNEEYEWEILKNAFKPFPCGIVCHAAIDACIQLREDLLASMQEQSNPQLKQDIPLDLPQVIERIDLKVHPLVLQLTAKRTPNTGLEGKFSVYHGCAVALVYSKAGPAQYTDETVQNSEVVAVRDRIFAAVDEGGVGADAAAAMLRLSDGGVLEKRVEHAVGSLARPMTDEQLTAKFVEQCAGVLGGEEVERVSEMAWRIGRTGDVGRLIERL